jgi:hypothetical protein
MWYIINYLFIGVVFTFLVDLFFNISKKRIACALLWPIGVIWFLIALIKNTLK